MEEQLDLVFPSSLEARFEAFHAANPEVYDALRALALAGVRSGIRRAGIGQLFEVLRWEHGLATRGEDYKLNNDHRAFYARLLMREEPELAGWFETREQRAA